MLALRRQREPVAANGTVYQNIMATLWALLIGEMGFEPQPTQSKPVTLPTDSGHFAERERGSGNAPTTAIGQVSIELVKSTRSRRSSPIGKIDGPCPFQDFGRADRKGGKPPSDSLLLDHLVSAR